MPAPASRRRSRAVVVQRSERGQEPLQPPRLRCALLWRRRHRPMLQRRHGRRAGARGPHGHASRGKGIASADKRKGTLLPLDERAPRSRARDFRSGRAASVSRRCRLAPALVAKCRGGRQGDDSYLQEVRTPRLIRRGSEGRRRDPTTPAAGSSATRARDRGPGPRRARDRWGATVDRRDGVLDDSEAATGDVRMRAHRRPLAEELVATGTRPRTRDCCRPAPDSRLGRASLSPTAEPPAGPSSAEALILA